MYHKILKFFTGQDYVRLVPKHSVFDERDKCIVPVHFDEFRQPYVRIGTGRVYEKEMVNGRFVPITY